MRVELGTRILARNDEQAQRNRARFARSGTTVVNLISSPGSGKTALLAATAGRLPRDVRTAVIVGDVATERDAERLRSAGLVAHQVVTAGACHLDADMVAEALDAVHADDVDLLFLENVGNLVCPASFDLGEDLRVVLLSVAEGEDKPSKYPGAFSRADVALVTKVDLLPHVACDVDAIRAQVLGLRPGARVLETSSRTGGGLDAWCALLVERRDRKRALRPAGAEPTH